MSVSPDTPVGPHDGSPIDPEASVQDLLNDALTRMGVKCTAEAHARLCWKEARTGESAPVDDGGACSDHVSRQIAAHGGSREMIVQHALLAVSARTWRTGACSRGRTTLLKRRS